MIIRLTSPVLLRGVTRAAGECVEVDPDMARSLADRGLAEPVVAPQSLPAPEPAPSVTPPSEAVADPSEDDDAAPDDTESPTASRKRRRR